MIERGALKFTMGGNEHVVKTDEVMRIAPDLVHSAQAVEDCVMVEVFSPRRQYWIDAGNTNQKK
jgi:quercetin dioxygenase-like cupin family protein